DRCSRTNSVGAQDVSRASASSATLGPCLHRPDAWQQPPIPAAVAGRGGSSSAFKIRFSVSEVYLRRFSPERTLSLRPAILSWVNLRSHLLMRAARVFIFKATSLPLSPLEAKESLWLVRSCAVRSWSFASNAKEFLFPRWKAG